MFLLRDPDARCGIDYDDDPKNSISRGRQAPDGCPEAAALPSQLLS